MGCSPSKLQSKYPAGPPPPRPENRITPAAIEVATTVMTPKLPVQPMGRIDDPVSKALSLSYGSCTIPGYDPARPRKPNQDESLIVEQFQHAAQSFFAVMDGHGTEGHSAARYTKRKLHKRLQRALPKKESITEAIDDAFVKTHDDLCSSKHDCSISGVTITAAFLRGDELFVANAGDCRAVVGRKKRQEGGGHTVEAIDLTVDHRPDRHDEKNRIEQCGGRCEPVKLQNEEDFVGPVRKNSPTHSPLDFPGRLWREIERPAEVGVGWRRCVCGRASRTCPASTSRAPSAT